MEAAGLSFADDTEHRSTVPGLTGERPATGVLMSATAKLARS